MGTEKLVSVLSALAQPTRLMIVRLLCEHSATGLTTSQLAELASTPLNTMSGHLGILARVGLVKSERSGRNITYDIVAKVLTDASGDLHSMAAAKPLK